MGLRAVRRQAVEGGPEERGRGGRSPSVCPRDMCGAALGVAEEMEKYSLEMFFLDKNGKNSEKPF